MNKEKISIKDDFIKLHSLLKFSNIVESGAMAKEVICNGDVTLNGEVCFVKGKKVFKGDTVVFLNNIIEVI